MKHLIRLSDFGEKGIYEVFRLADELRAGKHREALQGKTAVLFFPSASLRTRVTFEKGVAALGGQPILFPPETLDKKEDLKDVAGYLANWADLLVIRHRDIRLLERLAANSACPVVNAMTDENHPCEILSDLYALSRIRQDFLTGSGHYADSYRHIISAAFLLDVRRGKIDDYLFPRNPVSHELQCGYRPQKTFLYRRVRQPYEMYAYPRRHVHLYSDRNGSDAYASCSINICQHDFF